MPASSRSSLRREPRAGVAAGAADEPLAWDQCASPRLQIVGEQPGIYAAYVVGAPPARPPTPGDCHITATPGQRDDAVFGSESRLRGRKGSLGRALRVRFHGSEVRANRLLDVPCRRHRLAGRRVGAVRVPQPSRRASASTSTYAQATRYPEVLGRHRPGSPVISARALGVCAHRRGGRGVPREALASVLPSRCAEPLP